jgi:hypothetical protein
LKSYDSPLAFSATGSGSNHDTCWFNQPLSLKLASPSRHLRSSKLRQRGNAILSSRTATQRFQDDLVMPCGQFLRGLRGLVARRWI